MVHASASRGALHVELILGRRRLPAAAGEVSSRPSSTVLRRRGRRPLSRYGSDSSDEDYESSEEEEEAQSEDDEVGDAISLLMWRV
jgi:hypothetical protein